MTEAAELPFANLKMAVADCCAISRAGIVSTLEKLGARTIAEISDLVEMKSLLNANEAPDILILNLSDHSITALDVIGKLYESHSHVPFVVISSHSEEVFATRVLRAGGSGYLRNDCTTIELSDAISTVLAGRTYLSTKGTSAVIAELRSPIDSRASHFNLSDREHQVFLLICSGVSLVKIGVHFDISVKTVSTYRFRILQKLKLTSNSQLIQYAVLHKLIDPLST